MTTTTAPDTASDTVSAVYEVFRLSPHPLTVAAAQRLYKGPALSKKEWQRVVEEQLLMDGRLFRCSPVRGQARYWIQDEEQRVREAVELALEKKPLPATKLVEAVGKGLRQVSTATAIAGYIQAMRTEQLLHEHPGIGNAKLLALRPFDPMRDIAFKKVTLNDLGAL